MKVLVNGGLNLSALDGWWAEAWEPAVGWALEAREGQGGGAGDAEALYRLLEDEVVPAFYDRDAAGIPRAWVARIRASMARLTARFSANRMLREYVESLYLGAAEAYRRRTADGARRARELAQWSAVLAERWGEVRILGVSARPEEDGWRVEARIATGGVPAAAVRPEVHADAAGPGAPAVDVPLRRGGEVPGAPGAHLWHARVRTGRPATDFTVRVVPHHPEARIPAEEWHVRWER
jgi:starch phosphorylase